MQAKRAAIRPAVDAKELLNTTVSDATSGDDSEAAPANPVSRPKGRKSMSSAQASSPAPPTDGAPPAGDVGAVQVKGDTAPIGAAAGAGSEQQAGTTQSVAQEVKTDKVPSAVDENAAILPLSAITLDESIQCRAQLNKATVKEYAERMKAGDKFPALVVYKIEGHLLLPDGFHRYRAGEMAQLTVFPVDVRQGTRKDAVKFAIEANAVHGLARSNKDKRRAVELALHEFPDFSEHVIADLCKVSQPFVGKVRRQLITVISSEPRVGRDGKRRKMPKKKSASPPAQSAANSTGKTATTAQARTAGAVSLESNRTRASGDGFNGPEKAAHAQSDGKSKEPRDREDETEYSLDDAWCRISEFLVQEFRHCPKSMRRELGQQICRFVDRQC